MNRLGQLIALLACMVFIALVLVVSTRPKGGWYLGCTDGTKEYLMRVDKRPQIDNGFIVIGNDTYITPMQGMTCKVVRAEEVDNAKIGVDK